MLAILCHPIVEEELDRLHSKKDLLTIFGNILIILAQETIKNHPISVFTETLSFSRVDLRLFDIKYFQKGIY
jgi:hypothetical protein